jgi:hypothetical protein
MNNVIVPLLMVCGIIAVAVLAFTAWHAAVG